MNDFRQITAIAVDCLNPVLAARALERSMAQCDFAEAILLTDTPVPTKAKVKTIAPIRSWGQYSNYALRELGQHVNTPYLLIVQWDGFVLDARQWSSEFLKWDYIGAPWPGPDGPQVGNGGFCLRSRRLLDALEDPVFQTPGKEAEDRRICQVARPMLEQRYGVRFAPVPLAMRFSYEWYPSNEPTFGVHGLFNLWRHLSDTELLEFVDLLHRRTITHHPFLNLLVDQIHRGRYGIAQRMVKRALQRLAGADVETGLEIFRQAFKNEIDGEAFVATCRQLLALHVPVPDPIRRHASPGPWV